jgi:quercetin 2,3-dioxygenase
MAATAATAAAAGAGVGRPAGAVIAAAKQREGGGFVVRRPLPSRATGDSLGGVFLMLDHFGPVTYGPGEAVGAPDHPHRGFETVTYVLAGEMEHADSAGNAGVLRPGMVQWMTAGSGVVHSEMPSAAFKAAGGTMEGFQLWVNLPAARKMAPPRYQDIPADRIPPAPVPGATSPDSVVRVIAGDFNGTSAVIDTNTPIGYLDIRLGAGDAVAPAVPAGHVGFAYVYRGRGTFGANGVAASEGSMVLVGDAPAAAGGGGGGGGVFRVAAAGDAGVRAILVHGAPIREPIARYGPFVMNTREELMQAFEDYEAGRMGAIAGAEERYAETEAARAAQKRTGRWAADGKEL